MKQAVFSIGYTFTAKSFIFIINYLAVTYLVLKEYGEFSLFLSTITSCVVIASLGLLYSGNVVVSKWLGKNKAFVADYFKISMLIIAILSFVFSIVSYILTSYFFESFFAIFFFSLGILFESFFYGNSRYKELFIFGFLNLIVSIALFFALIKGFGLYGAILGFIFSKTLIVILQFRQFLKNFTNFFNFKLTKRDSVFIYFKKFNAPLLLSAIISGPILTLILYMLSYFRGNEEVAIYSWCYQIYLLGMFVPASLGVYYLTIFNKKAKQDKLSLMKKITLFNVSSTLLTILVLALISPLLLGVSEISNTPMAKYTFFSFLICMFFYSLNLSYMSLWVSLGKSHFHLYFQLIWSLTCVILSFIFLHHFSAFVIPLIMSLAYLCQFLIQKLMIYRVIKRKLKL